MALSTAGIGIAVLAIVAPGASAAPSLQLRPNHFSDSPGGANPSSFAAVGWASSNWSGYAVSAAPSSSFSSVSGHWKVSAVSRTVQATFSAA